MRYVVAIPARAWDMDDPPPPAPTVTVLHGDDAQPTGLIDQHGTPIYRVREPVGFRLRKDL